MKIFGGIPVLRYIFDTPLRAFVMAATIFAVAAPAPAQAADLDPRVVDAALATYVHGMTAEIAEREVGASGVGTLVRLLADPSFPRRDNVVAFLAYLGDDATVDPLVDLLRAPRGSLAIPEERRALLVVPEALGRIGGRGGNRSIESLLSMTGHDSGGGVIASAASRSATPRALRDDLLENALWGLHLSGDARAAERIEHVASGRVIPARGGRSLRPFADRLRFSSSSSSSSSAGGSPSVAGGMLDFGGGDVAGATSVEPAMDAQASAHDTRLDYANHVATGSPMTDSRADQVLSNASLRVGRSDFTADVTCCVGYSRKGTQKSFGTATDGRDKIDTDTELNSVLNDSSARVKVVNQINWCGGAGTNIIGCGWVGGYGLALVRLSSNLGQEAALWVHEYGHNVGLSHNNTSIDYIMYPSLGSNNRAVDATECNRYHSPLAGALPDVVVEGTCGDVDADAVHNLQDNCPTVSNNAQTDGDADGIGDVCESTCGNGVIDAGESCDGGNLAGQTCTTRGFGGGTLGCTSTCTFNTSACFRCGDGVIQGTEECDGGNLGGATCAAEGCTSGTPRCTSACTLDTTTCGGCPVCDGDGSCENGEDCDGCPSDCAASSGASCGDGVCQPGAGEDCRSCPQDCAGLQTGAKRKQFCCGDGAGTRPVGCGDSRCTAGALECSAATPPPACCGDDQCEGAETSAFCAVDCGVAPSCGDGACSGGETACSCGADCPATGEVCGDGSDNDCDGAVDCADSSCAASPACSCTSPGGACSANGDCCSFRCRLNGTCA